MSTFSTTSSTSSSYAGSSDRAQRSRQRHHHLPNDVIKSITAAQHHSFRSEPPDVHQRRREASRRRDPCEERVFEPVEFRPRSSRRHRHHRSRSRHSSYRRDYEDDFFAQFEARRSTGWDPSWNFTLSAQVSFTWSLEAFENGLSDNRIVCLNRDRWRDSRPIEDSNHGPKKEGRDMAILLSLLLLQNSLDGV